MNCSLLRRRPPRGLFLISAIISRVAPGRQNRRPRFVSRGLQTRSEQETCSEGGCNPRLTPTTLRPILESSPRVSPRFFKPRRISGEQRLFVIRQRLLDFFIQIIDVGVHFISKFIPVFAVRSFHLIQGGFSAF